MRKLLLVAPIGVCASWSRRCFQQADITRKRRSLRAAHHVDPAMKTEFPKTKYIRLAIAFAVVVSYPAPSRAQQAAAAPEEAGVAPISGMQIESQTVPASSKAPAGLLPVPDYSANIWKRDYLTGDWWGGRT